MPSRAIGRRGGRSDHLAKAIDFATEHGARVINASWGGGGTSLVIANAIARANRKGVLFVAAAGNDSAPSPSFPANLKLDNVISVGACRPTQREMDPALVARARLFVDSRTAALVESGDVVLGIQEGRFAADHIVAEIGELAAGAIGRRSDTEVTIFKSLGLAVEDVAAADLAYRRAVERGIGAVLDL